MLLTSKGSVRQKDAIREGEGDVLQAMSLVVPAPELLLFNAVMRVASATRPGDALEVPIYKADDVIEEATFDFAGNVLSECREVRLPGLDVVQFACISIINVIDHPCK